MRDWNETLKPGTNWRDTYPLVVTAAKAVLTKALAEEPVGEFMGMTELVWRIVDGTEPRSTARTRKVIVQALRAGCNHELKDWHTRVPTPNPFQPGQTRLSYMFHNYIEPKPEETCMVCGALKQHWSE